ncbi:glutamate--tRNA ligase [Candidatus Poribacteria bacterium]|nr:glutamate--tRNA ligase [Candidatus Poribacteria bacterium]OUT66975.1 MAG: glutamate--tRNA ligase [bacterium TMED15]
MATTTQPVRVRFAPSPTGYLHIGGARTALFNWLFAKRHNGTFILRIDDTDEQRSTESSMKQIYESLNWLGFNWDEGEKVGGPYGPYIQSERRSIYQEYIEKLIESGHAYYCYCNSDELAQMRQLAKDENRPFHYNRKCLHLTKKSQKLMVEQGRKPVIRFKVPDQTVSFDDLILGRISTESDTLQDEVIVKSNGSPLYNLTSIIDDHEMKISHVIRGADHLSNTPKQVLLAQALELDMPQFAHLPMVLGSSKGEKLSKRHGATSIEQYRNEGYLPQAMINFLVRLGWSLDDTTEIFSVSELTQNFDIGRVGKSGSVFDIKKLRWLNGHYINQLNLPERTSAVIPFLQPLCSIDSTELEVNRLEAIVSVIDDRLITLADIKEHAYHFFKDDFAYDPKGIKKWLSKDGSISLLQMLHDSMEKINTFDEKSVETAIWSIVDSLGIKKVEGLQPIRMAISGMTSGPSLFEMVILVGQSETLKRIKRLITYLSKGEN